jgi:hypothetical protein
MNTSSERFVNAETKMPVGFKVEKSVLLSAHDSSVLRKVNEYENPELVMRLQIKLSLDQKAAQLLFEDVKKFLAICALRKGNFSPTKAIDKGWHEFLMYTRDYDDFCHGLLGVKIHHQPDSYYKKKKSDKIYPTIIAEQFFGKLSDNWKCEVSATCCSGGDCSNSEGGCSHCTSDE